MIKEHIQKQPPGIHGVIIEIDLKSAKEKAESDQIDLNLIQFYSLKSVWITSTEPITPSETESDPEDQEMHDD